MIESDIIMMFSNYGFPIMITAWFMLRTEKVINRNTEAFEKITGVVEKCQRK